MTEGAVASYLTGYVETALTFPALSRHVPETDERFESGPPYEAVLHDAMPEVASEPLNERVTGLLNHPFVGLWFGVVPVTLGASVSMLY